MGCHLNIGKESRCAVIGHGSWATALVKVLTMNELSVGWFVHNPEVIESLRNEGRNCRYLPDIEFDMDRIGLSDDINVVVGAAEILFLVTPAAYLKRYLSGLTVPLGDKMVVSAIKGIVPDENQFVTDYLKKTYGLSGSQVCFVCGPTHAEEVARDLPSAIVAACREDRVARTVQDVFMNSSMRVYRSSDLLGVELCGALKNVIAIAAGACVGMGFGDNTRAALVTRGMAEIKRLGLKMGCRPETFDGLAGIGDMIVTSTSLHSRNMRAGMLIGQGMEPKKAVESIGMVVEGINALPAALELADRYQVELPITFAVDAVVNGGQDPRRVVLDLMMRDKKAEF